MRSPRHFRNPQRIAFLPHLRHAWRLRPPQKAQRDFFSAALSVRATHPVSATASVPETCRTHAAPAEPAASASSAPLMVPTTLTASIAPAASFAAGTTLAHAPADAAPRLHGDAAENTTLCTPSDPRSRMSSMASRLNPRVAVCSARASSSSSSVGLRAPCNESSSFRYALIIAKYFRASCSLRSAVFCA